MKRAAFVAVIVAVGIFAIWLLLSEDRTEEAVAEAESAAEVPLRD